MNLGAVKESLTLRLSGGPTAPGRARTALGSLDRSFGELRNDVHLLVSELVSNSVVHGGADQIELRASADPHVVRVEVTDPGSSANEPARREPSTNGGGGFGLFLVDKVAHRWGTDHDSDMRVWFEIEHRSDRLAEPAL
jgi:anti-sigma regulatory factor (Ser/Thr protein kinase)